MQMKLGKLLAETKTGEKRQIEPEKDGRGQKYEFELAGYHFFVRDMVKKTEESDEENQEYFITRRIVGKRKEASGKKEGIALSMYLEFGEETDIFRVGIPSAVYGAYVSREESTYHSFMEDRLTGVMLLLFDEDHKKSTVVQKMNPAKYIEKEERKRGEGRYLHKTETTSIGYGFGEAAYVKLCWPYEEREKGLGGEKSALEEIREKYGFETNAIVTMEEVVEHLYNRTCQGRVVIDDTIKAAIDDYYKQYGCN